MRLVDTHCHLYDERAFPDPARAVEEAAEAGVDRLIVIGIDGPTSLAAIALADRFPGVYATIGWHPTHVGDFDEHAIPLLREHSSHPKVVAIGEIGLDFYWDHTTPAQQIPALHAQLDLALEVAKPVVFHCRDAYGELLDLLERRALPPFVIHCYGGDDAQADRALALGGSLGVDGPLTYKKNDSLRATFARVPADRILIETDAPYLSPEPFRGQRNSPARVAVVNRKLAEIRGLSEADSAVLTTTNAERFFALAERS